MEATRLAAFARVRDEVASSSDRVRAICARHGVPWQAFYKHAKREGWGLRQRAQRRLSSLAALERLKDVVNAHLAELAETPLFQPASKADAMKLAQLCAKTLAKLDALERRERDERNAARRQKRARGEQLRKLLAERIDALRGYDLVDGAWVAKWRRRGGQEGDTSTDEGLEDVEGIAQLREGEKEQDDG